MKIRTFLENIEDFFTKNKQEESSLKEALNKLKDKRAKILRKLKSKDFKDEDKESLKSKLSLVKELKRKIAKKLSKLSSKKSIE